MKILKLKVWASKSQIGNHHVQVEEQTYRGRAFGDKKTSAHAWKAGNGIILASDYEPQWNAEKMILYVRGDQIDKDFRVLTVTPKELKLIQDAVDEYNSTFSDGTQVVKVKTEKVSNGVIVNLDKTQAYDVRHGNVAVLFEPSGKVLVKRNGVIVTGNLVPA